MTVKSCPKHNNAKTTDDIYVLAQICLCILHTNNIDAHDVFKERVIPQLAHNDGKLKKMLFRGAKKFESNHSKWTSIEVDKNRFDSFFTHLTHGIIFKQFGTRVNPNEYRLHHHYPSFITGSPTGQRLSGVFHDEFMKILFSESSAMSQAIAFEKNRKINMNDIYSIEILGADSILDRRGDDGKVEFTSSITVAHKIFRSFHVASLLTRISNFEHSPIHSSIHNLPLR